MYVMYVMYLCNLCNLCNVWGTLVPPLRYSIYEVTSGNPIICTEVMLCLYLMYVCYVCMLYIMYRGYVMYVCYILCTEVMLCMLYIMYRSYVMYGGPWSPLPKLQYRYNYEVTL